MDATDVMDVDIDRNVIFFREFSVKGIFMEKGTILKIMLHISFLSLSYASRSLANWLAIHFEAANFVSRLYFLIRGVWESYK